jgi:PAS domain S-box-containing protein
VNDQASIPQQDNDQRILELVRSIREAEQELEKLTGRQVASVAGSRSQTSLLQEAQAKIRQSEMGLRKLAETQRAILNALPAHIALVDSQGVILSVNEAWKSFGTANSLQGPDFGIGVNYLDICERAQGDCADEALGAALGIRRVLRGETEEFAIEYPCHSPTEKRWFRMMVSPLRDGQSSGAVIMHVNITERKTFEMALREGEREQRQLAEKLERERLRLLEAQAVAKVGSWETNLSTMSVIWSLETHRIFETDPATFQPTHSRFLELVHPEDRAKVDAAFIESQKSQIACSIEHRLLLNGRIKFIEERWQAVRDADGNPLRAVGTCQDITERHQAEEVLQVSEERYRSLASATAQIVWTTDADGRVAGGLPEWQRFTGQSMDEIQGHGWTNAVHPEDMARTLQIWNRSVQNRAEYDCEYRLRREDGVYREFAVRGTPVLAKDGHIVEWVGCCTDITDRKCAEERLAEQAALLDIAHEAILVKDLEDRIIYWNKGAERTYGWTAAEAVGRKSQELLGHDEALFKKAIDVLMSTGEWHGELMKLAKDRRELTVETRWTLVRDAEGKPKSILAINSDITEKKKLEAQFLRSQRMESIGTLAGGVAHDLNNILAPIMMSIDILRMKSDNPQTDKILETIQVSAKRGADIVRQVLSFARGMEGERVEIQPKHLIKDIDHIITETFPKDVQLDFTAPNDTWTILGDPTQIHQILLNLCVNARDAMSNGGKLTIKVENSIWDEQYAAMNDRAKPGRYVKMSVSDTGSGIAPAILDKIYEPFFTTKDLNKGTGLGLSTVIAIVKSHGGTINVESELNKGTTFDVYLPAVETSSEAKNTQLEETALPRGKGETILVVDDEASVLNITTQTLQAFGYRVLNASDGARAVAVFAAQKGNISVVITDMMMPVMDGAATVLALRRISPTIKIITASGLNATENIAKATSTGVSQFLLKPYTASTLLKAVRKILDAD